MMPFFIFIFFVLLFAYLFLIAYYGRGWSEIQETAPGQFNNGNFVAVTIVVPMRNEAHHVERMIRLLSNQDYPDSHLQIIFIDDHSTDDTWLLLQSYATGSNITCLQLPPLTSGKKKAIEAAIVAAKGDLIVTTDADCSPPATWISALVTYYLANDAKFVAAPVRMKPAKGLLGIFQALDFLSLQGITGASVHRKFHMMCNGANLAYEKQVFFEVNGFEGIDEIPSGDDMLLMYKIFNKYPSQVMYCKSRAAIVDTPAESSWRNFFQQRIRWASKAVHYKDNKIFYVLLLIYVINCCFLVLFIVAITNSYWWWLFVLLLVMKLLIEYPFVSNVAAFFGLRHLMIYFPLLQPLHIAYTIVAGWLGRFGSYQWKDRRIKNKGKSKLAKQ